MSRDGRRDRPQIVVGLLCAADGCPVAVEVFDGDTTDPATLAAQIGKLKDRFGLKYVVLVGDRGMITSARIERELRPTGFDWITALRAPAIQKLAAEGGPLQPSLFDQRDLAEIESPEFPCERLVVCNNPALAAERKRKRSDLLDATERDLANIQARVRRARRPLRGTAAIGQAVGAVMGRRKVAKHFRITIADQDLSFTRDQAAIAAEAAKPRSTASTCCAPACTPACKPRPKQCVHTKSLAHVERAFRSLNTTDLELRPIFHWTAARVRAHVLLCMLAYHLEWHMRQALAPLLFDDHDRAAAEAQRASPVAKAEPSPAARRKAESKRTDTGDMPVHSFRSLLADLATLTRNTVRFARNHVVQLLATPTAIQRRAFVLLDIQPAL